MLHRLPSLSSLSSILCHEIRFITEHLHLAGAAAAGVGVLLDRIISLSPAYGRVIFTVHPLFAPRRVGWSFHLVDILSVVIEVSYWVCGAPCDAKIHCAPLAKRRHAIDRRQIQGFEDGFSGSVIGVNEPEDIVRSGNLHFGISYTGDLTGLLSVLAVLKPLSDRYRFWDQSCWIRDSTLVEAFHDSTAGP